MNSGFKAYNGKAYDMAALPMGRKQKVVVPDRETIIQRHDTAGVLLICMEKRAEIHAHFTQAVRVADYRMMLG